MGMFSFPLFGDTFESIGLLNSKNMASYFADLLGFMYDSHGCLHFTPSDIYLLVKTIPKNTPLKIKMYNENPPDELKNIQFFNMAVNTASDINKFDEMFSSNPIKIVVYPSAGRLYIYVNGEPVFQVKTLAGAPQYYRQVFDLQKDGPVLWDPNLNTPTDYGIYQIFGTTSHYLSPTYYDSTIVPFGAMMVDNKGSWIFEEDGKWYGLPNHIIEDIKLPGGQRQYNYYDITEHGGKIVSARWGSHDFGKHALLWTEDGKHIYPELGYSEGELNYEQVVLTKDMADILTVQGTDEYEDCIGNNRNFRLYKDIYNFIRSNGEIVSDELDPIACSYYKLFNNIKLNQNDLGNIDSRLINAFNDYRNGNLPWLPWEKDKKEKTIGLYYFLRDYHLSFIKQAHYYKKIRDDWPLWGELRKKFRSDFDAMRVFSSENKQAFVESWLNSRLEFNTILPPKISKKASFAEFFVQEETTLFTQREKQALREIIRAGASLETAGLEMKSVNALNEYNFGVLLNEMLGNLYKSHGCLHVSPRNIYLLHKLLPIGCKIIVNDYFKKLDDAEYSNLPELAQMANFNEDLEELAKKFAAPADVAISVYPASRIWIIYLKNIPFAKMHVEAGPQSKIKILQERDKKGKPVFENETAYPTTPGIFYIFKKVDNYLSTIYYDLTVMPQDSIIKKEKDDWFFVNASGTMEKVPKSVKDDLNLPPDKRQFTYYDRVRDEKGGLVSAKWGDNPFGKYPIITSKNMKTQTPELVHTSGDLMMESRLLTSDLIRVLSAPQDKFEECIKYSKKFDLYSACFEFIADPRNEYLLNDLERGSYKLYKNIALSSAEVSAIPKDVFIAYKIVTGSEKLTKDEIAVLINERIAYYKGKTLIIDMEKIYGILYDIYQYVVAIHKNANIYGTLQKNWDGLSNLRKAMFFDFKTFIIKDPNIFYDFTRELTLKRVNMEKLSQKDAYILLESILIGKGL